MGDPMIEPNPNPDQPAADANPNPDLQGDAASGAGDGAAVSDVAAPAAAPQPAPIAQPAAQPEAKAVEPGKPLGNDAPKLADLSNQLCDNCSTGVLEVTRYDPFATYEANQGASLAAGAESGGAYDVRCRNCDFTESRAFNPGPLHGGRA